MLQFNPCKNHQAIPVFRLLVVQTVFVRLRLVAIHLFVVVNKHLKEIHLIVVGNVLLTMNARPTRPVSTTNVKIRVQVHVEVTRNVWFVCTAPCALAKKAILEIHSRHVT